MSDSIVRVENVSKKFSLNLAASMRYGLRDVIRDFTGRPINPDHMRPHEFWSLKDTSFEVKRGECMAILGPNGAGKSTMLKLLNGIFLPDKGRIEMHGRIGALIELGAGFSPMLTGRENIYVNGGILGLSKSEIDERFDAIVEFADIGNFLDTAVKFYSSGMYVRLGFSIAAQLKPNILLIDEILAVGDVGFRTKCFKHLNKLVEQGTSIIIVSHSPQALNRITNRALVFANGEICCDGTLQEGIGVYHNLLNVDRNQQQSAIKKDESVDKGSGKESIADIDLVQTVNSAGEQVDSFHTGDDVFIEIHIQSREIIRGARLIVAIENPNIGKFVSLSSPYKDFEFEVDCPKTVVRMCLKNIPLLVGGYKFNVSLFGPEIDDFYARILQVGAFKIIGPKIDTNGYGVCEAVYLEHSWEKV